MRKDEVLNSFLEMIKEHFGNHLRKVILFGSMVRKDCGPESDYDLLLIFDEINEEIKDFVEDLASEILIKYGKLFSTLLLSQKQFEQMRFEPFIINAQREGVVL